MNEYFKIFQTVMFYLSIAAIFFTIFLTIHAKRMYFLPLLNRISDLFHKSRALKEKSNSYPSRTSKSNKGLEWSIAIIAGFSALTFMGAIMYPNSQISEQTIMLLVVQVFALFTLIVRVIVKRRTDK